MSLVLWHTDPSVCSQKARLALAEVGAEWEPYVPDTANLEQHTPEFRRVSPDGVVPILIDDGLVVRESSLICEYLDETRNGGRLMPAAGPARVSAKLWLIKCLAIHAAINSVTFTTSIRAIDLKRTPEQREARWSALPDPTIAAKRREMFANGTSSVHARSAIYELNKTLGLMEDAISRDGWVSGAEYSLGDLCLTSYVDRMDRSGLGAMLRRYPGVCDWLERLRARPSYSAAITDKIGQPPSEDKRAESEAAWANIPGVATPLA